MTCPTISVSLLTHPHLLLLCVCVCVGAGATVRSAADRDLSGATEAHHLRGVHRCPVHTRAPAGQGLHAEDGGLQPPHTVSRSPPPPLPQHPPPPYFTGIAVAPPHRSGMLTAATDVSFKVNPGEEEEKDGGQNPSISWGFIFVLSMLSSTGFILLLVVQTSSRPLHFYLSLHHISYSFSSAYFSPISRPPPLVPLLFLLFLHFLILLALPLLLLFIFPSCFFFLSSSYPSIFSSPWFFSLSSTSPKKEVRLV